MATARGALTFALVGGGIAAINTGGPMRSVYVMLLFVAVVGCQRNEDGGTSIGLAPQTPHRCAACNGTGSITQSTEARLPAVVTECNVERTGFLGMATQQRVTVTVRNDGDEAGTFAFNVSGRYPGGGTVQHGHVAGVRIGPHASVSQALMVVPHDGMLTYACGAESPTVIQRSQSICPVCNGRGLVN